MRGGATARRWGLAAQSLRAAPGGSCSGLLAFPSDPRAAGLVGTDLQQGPRWRWRESGQPCWAVCGRSWGSWGRALDPDPSFGHSQASFGPGSLGIFVAGPTPVPVRGAHLHPTHTRGVPVLSGRLELELPGTQQHDHLAFSVIRAPASARPGKPPTPSPTLPYSSSSFSVGPGKQLGLEILVGPSQADRCKPCF